ncbi:MAG: relaxase/mobilization nuclease domain-containing protein [Eubacterium sp.]|nr:relaxase/mobilization nuclease domain-containing protein [Eubacterium sp.]
MAITKILSIGGSKEGVRSQHLRHALVYITNPEKTQDNTLVGSVNCLPDAVSAYEQMADTKKYFGKELGRQGYHIIISFEKGEASPGTAFAIGKKFVQEFLQENYEAVYAVHDDKEHCHVHIVYNNVHMETGYKFQYKKGDWKNIMQPITNRLCEEYGLAVMPAEYAKEPTNLERKDWERQKGFDSLIMSDASLCMYAAEDLEHFIWLLRQLGYEVKNGVHIAVRAAGMKRYRRLDSLADYFSKEHLEQYVGTMQGDSFVSVIKSSNPDWMRGRARTPLQKKFYHRLFSLRMTEKERFTRHSARFYKEIQEMHRIHEQYLYLCRKDIGSMADVQKNDEELQEKIEEISEKQRSIYRIIAKEKYRCKTPEDFQAFQIKRLEYQKELDILKERKKKCNDERKIIRGIRAEAAKKVLYELERYQTTQDNLEIDRKKIDFPFYPFSKVGKKRQEEELQKTESRQWDEELSLRETTEVSYDNVFAEKDTPHTEVKWTEASYSLKEQEQMLELIAIAEQIYGEEMDKETTGTGGVDVGIAPQGQSEYSDLPLSFAEYERLSYREKAERFHLPAKDYDEVKKAFDTYLNRIGYHYKYFGSYMDEIKALQKAVQDLHFEKAVENVAGQMKEQGIGAENFTRMSAEEMAEYFKGYVESMEDVTTLLLGIIKKLGVEMQFDKKYRFISEVYGEICEYKIQKSKMQKR